MQNGIKVELGKGAQVVKTCRFSCIFFLPKKKAFHVKGEKLNPLLSLKSFFIPTLRAQNPVDFMSLF